MQEIVPSKQFKPFCHRETTQLNPASLKKETSPGVSGNQAFGGFKTKGAYLIWSQLSFFDFIWLLQRLNIVGTAQQDKAQKVGCSRWFQEKHKTKERTLGVHRLRRKLHPFVLFIQLRHRTPQEKLKPDKSNDRGRGGGGGGRRTYVSWRIHEIDVQ